MLIMKYEGLKTEYAAAFSRISDHVIQLLGDFPAKAKRFTLSREGKEDNWDYSAFNTIYREIDGGVQFSDDGSVYVAPPVPEPEPEPEPYVPTLEEVKEYKKQEIMSTYQMVKTAGFDIELSSGTEHFPLTDEDTTFYLVNNWNFRQAQKKRSHIRIRIIDARCILGRICSLLSIKHCCL